MVPTNINKKLASIKVEILKIFLLEFNKIIPIKVSQKASIKKIKGKKVLGSEWLAITFNVDKGKIIASIKLKEIKNFFIKIYTTLHLGKYVSYIKYIQINENYSKCEFYIYRKEESYGK